MIQQFVCLFLEIFQKDPELCPHQFVGEFFFNQSDRSRAIVDYVWKNVNYK